jgi:AraC-like DNA-binding protein
MPAATYFLFQPDMTELVDRVVPLQHVTQSRPDDAIIEPDKSPKERIEIASYWLETIFNNNKSVHKDRIAAVTESIIAQKGMTDIESLSGSAGISLRHLQREFKKIIGLTPKYFSRIIQFSYIFEAMQASDRSWVDIALNSGYFDQSHFISNFKAFTGESPAKYGFDREDMANFFLKPG